MAESPLKPLFYLLLVIISLVIAVISFFGVILKDDLTGRIIFGTVWTFVAVIWTGYYLKSRKPNGDVREIE
jgi:hypothetical protein